MAIPIVILINEQHLHEYLAPIVGAYSVPWGKGLDRIFRRISKDVQRDLTGTICSTTWSEPEQKEFFYISVADVPHEWSHMEVSFLHGMVELVMRRVLMDHDLLLAAFDNKQWEQLCLT